MFSWPDQRLRKIAILAQLLLFFAVVYVLLWKRVDLEIVYHGGGIIANVPVFYWGAEFFKEWLPQPAGLLGYTRALLFQSFYHSWLGAAVVTVQIGVIYGLGQRFMTPAGRDSFRVGALLPGVFLLGAFSRHISSIVAVNTACCLIVALALAWAYTRLEKSGVVYRIAAVLAASAAVLFSFPGALVLFLSLVAIVELHRPGRWVVIAAAVVAGLCLPLMVGIWGYDLNGKESLASILPFSVTLRAFRSLNLAWLFGAYFALPLVLVAERVWVLMMKASSASISAPVHQAAPQLQHAHHVSSPSHRSLAGPAATSLRRNANGPEASRAGWARWGAESGLVLAAAFGICAVSINEEIQATLRVDYSAFHRDWKGVLAAAKGNPNSIHVQCAVNQALFHLGRLGDDLNLRQYPEALVLYDQSFRPDWNVIDVYLDLGFVGMAHHYLIEAMDIYGERPALLRRIVLVNTVLGNVGTAKIYLSALAKVPFHRDWARRSLAEMQAKPSMSEDKEVARLRSVMMTRDQVVPLPIDQLMISLLEANPRNRMAFEYLMAYLLINRNLNGFVAQLPRLGQFSMGELPRFYQEAMVVAADGLGLNLDLARWQIPSTAIERFRKFVQLRQRSAAGQVDASRELEQEFGGSYYYYHFVR